MKKNKHIMAFSCLLCIIAGILILFSSNMWAATYTITNLTENINSGATTPTLNDNGQVAWTQTMFLSGWGGYGDIFLEGVNFTNLASNYSDPHSTGGAYLNNDGQIAWIQSNKLIGEADIFLDGVNLTANLGGNAHHPVLNNKGQIVWRQYVGSNTHVFFDGADMTPNLLGYATMPSINDNGQIAYVLDNDTIILDGMPVFQGVAFNVNWMDLNNAGQIAWMSHTGGGYDIFLDGVNLTENISGSAMRPNLNDKGQLAYELWTGSEWDIILDGINLTENISGNARDPSLNNFGQIAWSHSFGNQQDIYLATPNPVLEPTIDAILNFFDASVADGTLEGYGPGNSANGRLNALRNMLEMAGDLINIGDIEGACGQLKAASKKCDDDSPPPDFVEGSAASELYDMILKLMAEIGCE